MAHNDAPQTVGLLWTSDQLVAVTYTWHIILTTENIHDPAGFETLIPASERSLTYDLDPAATGTGSCSLYLKHVSGYPFNL